MFYVFAWCLKDEASFNDAVPLDLLAESYRRHGSTIPITVVFLEGYAALSRPYLDGLERQGMRVVDFTAGFAKIVGAFPNIVARYSHYERNCFLRWPAFQEIYRSAGLSGQVWHLDGDVILHASTDAIAADTASKTFMLQGCPVLVSISDPRWFSVYRTELEKLEADIGGYSQEAHALKPAIAGRNRELCNVTPYRNPLGSDQDLLEFLISAGILMQDRAERIFASNFYFIQNPLVARHWDDLQGDGKSMPISDTDNGGLRHGDKAIPFTHYQNGFCHYASLYLALARYGLGRFMPPFVDSHQADESTGASPRFRAVSALLRRVGVKIGPRRRVIMALAGRRRGGASALADVLNHLTR